MKTILVKFAIRLLDWSLAWKKYKLLHEILRDIDFINSSRKSLVNFDDTKARLDLAALKKKEGITPEDEAKAETLSTAIAESRATKVELHRLKGAAEELPVFIEMLIKGKK